MTEAEWLICTDPRGEFGNHLARTASPRTQILVVSACCRLAYWHLLPAEIRKAVEVAELFADGAANDKDRSKALRTADDFFHRQDPRGIRLNTDPAVRAAFAARFVIGSGEGLLPKNADERRILCHALREVLGNGFRSVAVDPNWLSWNGGAVARLAQAAYTERHPSAGTLHPHPLADPREEAGCPNAGLLGPLRSEGPHFRGCWVVDLLLEKS